MMRDQVTGPAVFRRKKAGRGDGNDGTKRIIGGVVLAQHTPTGVSSQASTNASGLL